jgi:hypothetical protein
MKQIKENAAAVSDALVMPDLHTCWHLFPLWEIMVSELANLLNFIHHLHRIAGLGKGGA